MHQRSKRLAAFASLLLFVGLAMFLLTRPKPAPKEPESADAGARAINPEPTLTPGPTKPTAASTEEIDIPAVEPATTAPTEPFKGTIQGSVTDAVTLAPLEEFQLLVKTGQFINYNPRKHRGFQTVHSPDGLFFINEVPARGVTVFVRAAGYEPAFRYVAGLESDTAISDVDFALMPQGSIQGVTTDRFGTSLEGIEVFVGVPSSYNENIGSSTTTNANGEYWLSSVPTGRQMITAFSKERGTQSVSVEVHHKRKSTMNFVFDEVPPVEGIVRFGRDAIPGSLLTLLEGEEARTTVTDARGRFRFAESPLTSCTIHLEDVPYYLPETGATITGSAKMQLTVSVPRSFERKPLDIDFSTILSGVRLTVMHGGRIQTNWTAHMTIVNKAGLRQSQSFQNDGNESYFIFPLLAGSCSVSVMQGGGFETGTSGVFISSGGELIQFNTSLDPPGFLINRTIQTRQGMVTVLTMSTGGLGSTTTMVTWEDAMDDNWPPTSESLE